MSHDPITGGPCYLADIRRGACRQIADVRFNHTKWKNSDGGVESRHADTYEGSIALAGQPGSNVGSGRISAQAVEATNAQGVQFPFPQGTSVDAVGNGPIAGVAPGPSDPTRTVEKWEKPVEQKADDIGEIVRELRRLECKSGCGTMQFCVCSYAGDAADALERLSTELRKANGRLNLLEQERDEACAENARLQRERDAAEARLKEAVEVVPKGDMTDKATAWDACIKAREEERERCAKIAEHSDRQKEWPLLDQDGRSVTPTSRMQQAIAAAIRASVG